MDNGITKVVIRYLENYPATGEDSACKQEAFPQAPTCLFSKPITHTLCISSQESINNRLQHQAATTTVPLVNQHN